MDKGIVLVTELLQGGELFERCVDEEVTLTEQDCCHFIKQVGMQYTGKRKWHLCISLFIKGTNLSKFLNSLL